MISYAPFWRTIKEKGVSQFDLYTYAKISTETLFRLRNDKIITTNTIDKLCKILNCKVNDILEFRKGE